MEHAEALKRMAEIEEIVKGAGKSDFAMHSGRERRAWIHLWTITYYCANHPKTLNNCAISVPKRCKFNRFSRIYGIIEADVISLGM